MSPGPRRAALWLGVAGAVASLCMIHASAGCSEGGAHVYEGRFYVEERDCLGTISTLDVVDGPPPDQYCPAVCLVQRQPEGGRAIYTSIMCAPYPFGFDLSGTDPKCAMALAAQARNDTCLSDGGSSAPAPKIDAGDKADASDASSD